eukprot:jgi/Psemu1/39762/gm1.39762_g
MSEGILMTGFVAALIACFVPLEALANLISLGTLMNRNRNTFDSEHSIEDEDDVAGYGYSDDGDGDGEGGESSISEVHGHNKKRIIQLLIVFTASVLGASFILSNNSLASLSGRAPLALLSAFAFLCGVLICYTPDSWTGKKQQSLAVSTHFECPWFPVIPCYNSTDQ